MKILLQTTFLMLLCSVLAHAQINAPGTLKVGDAAPALAGAKWVKGEPVTRFEPGKIYVVEFWATWCGPCVAAIPHVSQMQAAYAHDGVTFIGQNVWENDQAAVEPFVKKMGTQMDYRVVMDDMSAGGHGNMAETWMDAAGENGIPCSFLIGRDGKLAWIGHPMALEPVLKQVIAGTFDPQKSAIEMATFKQFEKDLNSSLSQHQWDNVISQIDAFELKQPDTMRSALEIVRFHALLEQRNYAAAYKLAAELAKSQNDDANDLNELAWTIATMPGLEKRDLDLADQMATRAVEITKASEPHALDTQARVQFERGRIDKAIEIETEAANKAAGREQAELQATLQKYKDAKRKTD